MQTVRFQYQPTDSNNSGEAAAQTYKVSGVVFSKRLGPNQKPEPIANQIVKAFDVDLRGSRIFKTVTNVQTVLDNGGFELLGNAVTNAEGHYEISFATSQFEKADISKREDLVVFPVLADVIVFAVNDNNTITGRSVLSVAKDYKSGTELKEWNITLETADHQQGITEYTRIMQPVNTLLESSGLSLFELFDSVDQITFLANETGQNLAKVTLLVQADKLISEATASTVIQTTNMGSGTPESRAMFHELLYGLGRQNIKLEWNAIGHTPEGKLRAAINKSVDENIIAAFANDMVNGFIEGIQQYGTDTILSVSDPAKTTDIKKLLSYALPDASLHGPFFTAYKNFTGKPEQFWNEYLPQQPGFNNPALIQALQFGNQLAMLTGNHLPLIEELQVTLKLTSPKQLLDFSEDYWKGLLDASGWPDGITEDTDKLLYIANIQNTLNASFPTEKIALMVKNDELKYDEYVKPLLGTFFETDTTFDFKTSRVIDHKTAIDSVTNGNAQHAADLTHHLQTIQRVFQVSPTVQAMAKLLDLNMTSAYKIANIPEESFVQNYGYDLTEDIARKVHARAAYQTLRTQNIAMMIHELTNGIMPAATTFSAQQKEIAAVIEKYVPNYKELFG